MENRRGFGNKPKSVTIKRTRDARRRRQNLIATHLGLTQAELVELMNLEGKVAREDISKFERGIREPSLPILLKYARLVCISTDVLIEEKAELPFSADD